MKASDCRTALHLLIIAASLIAMAVLFGSYGLVEIARALVAAGSAFLVGDAFYVMLKL